MKSKPPTAEQERPVSSTPTRRRHAQIAHDRIVATFAERIRRALERAPNDPSERTPAGAVWRSFKGFAVDETAVDETAVDETAVDETAVDETAAIDIRAPDSIETMARRLAARVEAVAKAYAVAPGVRLAVCGRLAQRWRLDNIGDADIATWVAHVDVAGMDRAPAPGLSPGAWPDNISVSEARAALERVEAPEARDMAAVLRDGRWFGAGPGEASSQLGDNPQPGDIYHPCIAALVAWAEKARSEAHASASAFVIPSHALSRATVAYISTGGKESAWEELRDLKGEGRALLRVKWDGKLAPVQLALPFAEGFAVNAVMAVMNELSEDGLTDWLAFLAMADAQGRTGEFLWSWKEHRRITGYDLRVRQGWSRHDENGRVVRLTDDTARRLCLRRILRLASAELWEEVDGKLSSVPVGGGPLLRVKGLVAPDGIEFKERAVEDFAGAKMALNWATYYGAHRDSKEPHFTAIPLGVFRLPERAKRLAVLVCFAERYRRDDAMRVTFQEWQLMQMSCVRGDGRPGRRDIGHAREELRRYMDAVNAVMADGGSWETRETPRGREYDRTPAVWRVEREVLQASAGHHAQARSALASAGELPARAQPSGAPCTGADLVAWRRAFKLSQRAAADLLDVGIATVKRAELRPADDLPRGFRDVDWSGRPSARQLAKPSESPSASTARPSAPQRADTPDAPPRRPKGPSQRS